MQLQIKRGALWLGWVTAAVLTAGSAMAEFRGDVASGPCAGEEASSAVAVHLQPALLTNASWADFHVPASATHFVLCEDGEPVSYHVLAQDTDTIRMRIGNRWVLKHLLLAQDLDLYSLPDRWTVLYDDGVQP